MSLRFDEDSTRAPWARQAGPARFVSQVARSVAPAAFALAHLLNPGLSEACSGSVPRRIEHTPEPSFEAILRGHKRPIRAFLEGAPRPEYRPLTRLEGLSLAFEGTREELFLEAMSFTRSAAARRSDALKVKRYREGRTRLHRSRIRLEWEEASSELGELDPPEPLSPNRSGSHIERDFPVAAMLYAAPQGGSTSGPEAPPGPWSELGDRELILRAADAWRHKGRKNGLGEGDLKAFDQIRQRSLRYYELAGRVVHSLNDLLIHKIEAHVRDNTSVDIQVRNEHLLKFISLLLDAHRGHRLSLAISFRDLAKLGGCSRTWKRVVERLEATELLVVVPTRRNLTREERRADKESRTWIDENLYLPSPALLHMFAVAVPQDPNHDQAFRAGHRLRCQARAVSQAKADHAIALDVARRLGRPEPRLSIPDSTCFAPRMSRLGAPECPPPRGGSRCWNRRISTLKKELRVVTVCHHLSNSDPKLELRARGEAPMPDPSSLQSSSHGDIAHEHSRILSPNETISRSPQSRAGEFVAISPRGPP